MSLDTTDVLVIGGGVSGLTTAVCLAEAGIPVRVVTRDAPETTTSAAAGAIWAPMLAGHEHMLAWSGRTRAALTALACDVRTGVRLVEGVEAARVAMPPPDWAYGVADFRPCRPAELPDGFVSGWRYTVPLVDMPVYLGYLVERLEKNGGSVERGEITSLPAAAARHPVTVNCCGAGARRLAGDDTLTPVRGQVVVVDNPGIEQFFADHTESTADLIYILPHGDRIVLGGSVRADRVDLRADRLDLRADPAVTEQILGRCASVEPRLAGARARTCRVGLRPMRPRIRVERAEVAGRNVIHNYGHGGAGVTLSWGCARTVLDLVRECR